MVGNNGTMVGKSRAMIKDNVTMVGNSGAMIKDNGRKQWENGRKQ